MKRIFILIALISAFATASAQSYIGSNELLYHSQRSPQSNFLNPAIFPSQSMLYITAPAVDFSFSSPLSLSDMLTYTPGDSVTRIDFNKMCGKLSQNSAVNLSAEIDLIGLGFTFGNNFITLNSRAIFGLGVGLPIEAINMLSQGNLDADGNVISQVDILNGDLINQYAYMETAIGFGHEFENLGLTVGGRVKLLGGISSISTTNTNVTLNTTPDMSDLTANIYYNLQAAAYMPIDTANLSLISPEELTGYVPPINGIAFDLGATYKWKKWEFSAAILNLSKGIKWDQSYQLEPEGSSSFSFSGLDITGSGLLENGTFNTDTLTSYYRTQLQNLNPKFSEGTSFTQPIPTKLNLGAGYQLTRNLRVGALFHGQWEHGWFNSHASGDPILANFRSTTTLSASFNIGNWFEIIAGNSFVNDGNKFDVFNPGVGLILTPLSIIQIYAMADYVSSIYVVEAKDLHLKVGLNILFGNKRFVDAEKEAKEAKE